MNKSDAAGAGPYAEDLGVGWMLQVQAGQIQAFVALVDHYQLAACSMLRRLLGRHGPWEDLAQEAFLRVWRSRENYRPQGKFTTYLYRICYHLALNQLRGNKRKPLCSLPKDAEGCELEVEAKVDANPSTLPAELKEWGDLIQAALAKLPQNQRAAVVFQHYDGLELQEIAEILSISPQAAKSLVHRARENLRILLSPFREAEND